MGLLEDLSSGRTIELRPEQTIGRAPSCALRLTHRYVSGHHALIRWSEGTWRICDLGSRNGTFYDGVRLGWGQECVLKHGGHIAFGKRTEPGWGVAQTSPPRAMVIPLDGGAPLLVEREMLALPSSNNPAATIYASQLGEWVMESPEQELSPLGNGSIFDVAGRAYRFCCAPTQSSTATEGATTALAARDAPLELAVTDDEARVELRVICGDEAIELGSGPHNALLLKLARRLLEDRAGGLAESACGWTNYADLVEAAEGVSQLDLSVFRIRQMFAETGLVEPARIIERRPRKRLVRMAARRISIEHLQ